MGKYVMARKGTVLLIDHSVGTDLSRVDRVVYSSTISSRSSVRNITIPGAYFCEFDLVSALMSAANPSPRDNRSISPSPFCPPGKDDAVRESNSRIPVIRQKGRSFIF